MCECIKKIKERLKEEYGESVELTNTTYMVPMEDGKPPGKGITKPDLLRFKFHPKNKDGSESKRWIKSFVTFRFCPFCGKEYTIS